MIVIHLKTHSQKLYNRLFTYLVKKMNKKTEKYLIII